MFSKIIIGVLIVLFILAVGMFFYSTHQLNQLSSNIPSSSPVAPAQKTTDDKAAPTIADSPAAQTLHVQQPDIALPIPAHQLKKIIADKSQRYVIEPASDKSVEQKIQAANQSISELAQSLPDDVKANDVSSEDLRDKDAKSVQPDVNSQRINDINQRLQRLQHLRDHLDKQNITP
jgi:hypothetical protein